MTIADIPESGMRKKRGRNYVRAMCVGTVRSIGCSDGKRRTI